MLKYVVDLLEFDCSCPAAKYDHSKSCKHVKNLLVAGVHRHDDNKFKVFKDYDGQWYAGNKEKGFVGTDVVDVMTAIYAKG